jgi:hypothetical protein
LSRLHFKMIAMPQLMKGVNTHGIALINKKEAGLLPTSRLNNMAASC